MREQSNDTMVSESNESQKKKKLWKRLKMKRQQQQHQYQQKSNGIETQQHNKEVKINETQKRQ